MSDDDGIAAWDGPTGDLATTVLVLGHGAGGDHRAKLLADLAERLAAQGISVVRFDFPYRRAGKKLPDPMPRLVPAFRQVVAAARRRAPRARLFLGGKSMGGRAATHLAAEGEDAAGVVLLGYPLHPAGKRERLRDAHLPDVPLPMLFLQGTRDDLCDLDLLRPVLARCGGRAKLTVIEDGDHSLEVRRASGTTNEAVRARLADAIASFVAPARA